MHETQSQQSLPAKLNKLGMKLNIKHLKMNKMEVFKGSLLKPSPETEATPNTQKRRRASENLKDFNYISIFNDKKVEKGFLDLFQLGDKLGEGAQSVVYRCKEKKSGKVYSVKVCKKRDMGALESMRVNYQILMELKHDAIIRGKYLFMDETKLTGYMVMEEFNHPELSQYLANRGPLNEQEVAEIMESLLDCLCYLRSKGVCHRDIKPDNILYDPKNRQLKLIDFELAKMHRYSHEALELLSRCGTSSYRAPETFKGAYGIQADMWGAGVVALQLLIGRNPFKGQYCHETIKNVCEKQIPFEEFNLSPCAVKFLKSILVRAPQQRATPKQAISSSFILKNLKYFDSEAKPNLSIKLFQKIRSINQNVEYSELGTADEEYNVSLTKSYTQEDDFGFSETFEKDIGVRRYRSDE